MTIGIRGASLVLFLAAGVIAQLPGDIGVSGFSSSQMSVLDGAGVEASYAFPSFLGSGTSQSILWDPTVPSSFIVGGFGFVGRVTITGPGTATYALIGNGASTAAQMSFDAAGQIVIADAGIDQMVSMDPATGIVTPLTSGTQPWAATVNAGVIEPISGDLYVGSNGAIHKVSGGVTTPVWTSPSTPAYVSGIAFDPFSGDLIATVLTVNRLIRIDAAGTVTDIFTPGTLTGMNSVSVDQNGDFVVGVAGPTVHRVINGSGVTSLIGSATGIGSSASGVSVVGGLGTTPVFSTRVSFNAALDASVIVTALPAGTVEGWTFFTTTTPTPVGGGSVFGITPDAITISLLTLFPTPQVGNVVHWIAGVPGFYPSDPFVLPAGSYASFTGQTWDLVSLAFDGGLGFLGASAVGRVTWP